MQAYPQIVDYNEAVQHPATAFTDPELREARLKENGLGLPLVLSGGFALTYMLAGPRRTIAARCFHRHIPGLERKYAAISEAFCSLDSPYFVRFEFLGQGIRVRHQLYPALKMEWAEGEVLNLWLERNHDNPHRLAWARQGFSTLAGYLEARGISHGDIQNGNVIMSPHGLRLVDYDGVYVPGMPVGEGAESGHKHFQHPGRDARHHGPGLDRFSFIAVDLSLAALIEEPPLFRRYCEGGETILFRANDFADPDRSPVFRALAAMPKLAAAADRFAQICRAPLEAVPTLQAFLAEKKAAAPPREVRKAAPSAPTRPPSRYIGSYPVLDATDFASVIGHVGQRVELVGRIVSVEPGTATGRHRGRPCYEVNFSRHWRDRVRFTVWSDPATWSASFGRDWVGRWVGAVGLIDQPWVTDAFWKPRTRVGITLEHWRQMNFMSAEEAEFRLNRTAAPATDVEGAAAPPFPAARKRPPPLGNRQMVARLQNRGAAPIATAGKPGSIRPPAPSARSNTALLGRLRSRSGSVPKPVTPPATSPSPAGPAQQPAAPRPAIVLHPRARTAIPDLPRHSQKPRGWMEIVRRKFGLGS